MSLYQSFIYTSNASHDTLLIYSETEFDPPSHSFFNCLLTSNFYHTKLFFVLFVFHICLKWMLCVCVWTTPYAETICCPLSFNFHTLSVFAFSRCASSAQPFALYSPEMRTILFRMAIVKITTKDTKVRKKFVKKFHFWVILSINPQSSAIHQKQLMFHIQVIVYNRCQPK